MENEVFDADLVAYIVLSDCMKNKDNECMKDDIMSKMNIHAKKIKNKNLGVVIRV
jgi:hypothetical protein